MEFASTLEYWTTLTIWLVPLIFFVTLASVWQFWVWPLRGGERAWKWVDAAWVGSSAVTLFFLILSTAAEPFNAKAQHEASELMRHGNDLFRNVADLVGKYCVSPVPPAGMRTDFRKVICDGALEEEHATMRVAARYQDGSLPKYTLPPSVSAQPSTDAEIWATRDWELIRSKEALWNETTDKIGKLTPIVTAYAPIPVMRITWFYLYAPLVALRLGRSLWDIRRPRRPDALPNSEPL